MKLLITFILLALPVMVSLPQVVINAKMVVIASAPDSKMELDCAVLKLDYTTPAHELGHCELKR